MSDDRLILCIYLEPHVWLANDGKKIMSSILTPAECLEIVFSKKLQNGIEVCTQRQGFVIAAIPQELIGDPTIRLYRSNVLPASVARYADDFFNSFLYMFYEQLHRNKTFYGIKQGIVVSDLWRWFDRPGVDLSTIAVEQPMPLLNQHAQIEMTLDNVPLIFLKTRGELSDLSQLFRHTCSTGLIDAAFDAIFVQNSDYKLNWQLMALLNKSILSMQRGEFAQAHILCWAVAEKLIQIMWDEYLVATGKFSNTKSGFANAKQSDELKSANMILDELHSRLDAARDSRNGWMHDLNPIGLEDCRNCYVAARDLLSAKLNYSIDHPGGYYMFDENIRSAERE